MPSGLRHVPYAAATSCYILDNWEDWYYLSCARVSLALPRLRGSDKIPAASLRVSQRRELTSAAAATASRDQPCSGTNSSAAVRTRA